MYLQLFMGSEKLVMQLNHSGLLLAALSMCLHQLLPHLPNLQQAYPT